MVVRNHTDGIDRYSVYTIEEGSPEEKGEAVKPRSLSCKRGKIHSKAICASILHS